MGATAFSHPESTQLDHGGESGSQIDFTVKSCQKHISHDNEGSREITSFLSGCDRLANTFVALQSIYFLLPSSSCSWTCEPHGENTGGSRLCRADAQRQDDDLHKQSSTTYA